MAALLIYGTVRIAIDQFLLAFGLSAEETGLSYDEILAPIASVFLLATVVVGLTGWALLPYLKVIHSKFAERAPTSGSIEDNMDGLQTLLAILLFVDLVVLGTGGLLHLLGKVTADNVGIRPSVNFYSATVGIALVLFVFGLASSIVSTVAQNARGWITYVRPRGRSLVFALFAIMLIGFLFGAGAYGRHEALLVTEGNRVRPTLLGVAFPGIEAAPVIVTAPIGSPDRFLDGKCVMHLAHIDEIVFLYDPAEKELLRSSIVNLSLSESEEPCPRGA